MSELHDAYRYLGVPLGSPYDPVVKRRYNRLVMVWHPDRAPDDPKWKEEATEELKKINNYHDIIKKHFENDHKNGDQRCACQPEVGKQAQSAYRRTSSGTTSKARTAEERQKASEEAAKQARQASVEEALKQEEERRIDQIKWRIARGSGVAFVILFVFSWLCTGIKGCVYSLQHMWGGGHSSSSSSSVSIIKGGPYASPFIPPGLRKDEPDVQEDKEAFRKKEEQRQAEREQMFRQNRARNLRNDIDSYKWELGRLKDQISNIDGDMATEAAKAKDNEAKMSGIEKSLGVNFTNSAADRRWHPSEYSEWQAFSTMANQARRSLDVMQTQKDNMLKDRQNLQAKIDKAQEELGQLAK